MKTNFFKKSSLLSCLSFHPASVEVSQPLPFFLSAIQAGFPSPADDYIENALDLNELIVKHPAATFYVRVQGDSMENAGIYSDDILVVDRSLTAYHKSIVLAVLDGEFTVKRLMMKSQEIYLVAENASYPHIKIRPDTQFEVWGVVTYVIHKAR